jgi:hypothetical protein
MRTAPANKSTTLNSHPALCNCPYCKPPSRQPERDAVDRDETVQRLAVVMQTAKRRLDEADAEWIEAARRKASAELQTSGRPVVVSLDTATGLPESERDWQTAHLATIRRLEAEAAELRRVRDALGDAYAKARLEHDAAVRAMVRRFHELGNVRDAL